MRRTLILPIFLILLLTLILLGINYFTPLLTPERTDNLPYLLLLAIIAAITIVTGVLALRERGKGAQAGQVRVDEKLAKRDRDDMLQLVWNTWIEDVLKKGLYFENPIMLDLKTEPDAIAHPYDLLLSIDERKPEVVPSGRPMLEHLDSATGALLILGEPGSGKSTLQLEMASQAIQRAQQDPQQPIPVVFKLSSWTPEQTLAEWLLGELRQKYHFPVDISRQWVEGGWLLLLLDGLDEVKAEYRAACVQAINAYRDCPGAHMAVTCRVKEYEDIGVKLNLHGALMVQSLNRAQVDAFLAEEGAALGALKEALESDEGLRQFASTPLVLSVMKQTYQDGGEERLEALKSAEDYRTQLFEDYVARMFKHRKDGSSYALEDIRRWLSWLAGLLRDSGQSLFYVEDIRINKITDPGNKYRLIFGLISGFIFSATCGLFIVVVLGLSYGLGAGMLVGIVLGVLAYIYAYNDEPAEELKVSYKGILRGLMMAVIICLIGGFYFTAFYWWKYDINIWQSFNLISYIYFVIIMGIFAGVAGGVERSPARNRNIPGMGIKASRRNMLSFGLILTLTGYIMGLVTDGRVPPIFGGMLTGVTGGFLFGGNYLISHYLSRWHLVRSGNIPWKVIPFLNFCSDHILLQRAGGGYQFIHPMLKDYFAALPPPPAP